MAECVLSVRSELNENDYDKEELRVQLRLFFPFRVEAPPVISLFRYAFLILKGVIRNFSPTIKLVMSSEVGDT